MVAIALNLLLVVDPLDDVLYWSDQLQLAQAAFARLATLTSPARPRAAPVIEAGDATVRAHGVRFAYEPGVEAVAGIDFEASAGSNVALVGPSGAGKTTIGLLVCGVLQPSAGSVLVGGADPVESPGLAVMVTQEPYVFAGSLADNLRLGSACASAAEMLAALSVVGAGHLAAADGLETVVDETSVDIVDAQRLSLARLVLNGARAVVVDEATSAMTTSEAARVKDALHAALAGRTQVVITHRMQDLADCDAVWLVVDGGVTRLGSGGGTTADEVAARSLAALGQPAEES